MMVDMAEKNRRPAEFSKADYSRAPSASMAARVAFATLSRSSVSPAVGIGAPTLR